MATDSNTSVGWTSLGRWVFVHLSDIHFKNTKPNDPFDLDVDLRVQLERDLAIVRDKHGPLDGLLVTGDVAFSGDPMQYENATRWFGNLGVIGAFNGDAVWVVPGNHDIDRDVIAKSQLTIGHYHEALRGCSIDDIDAKLEELLRGDATAREVLLKPLANYSSFADRYGCGFVDGNPHWHYASGSTDRALVAIRGINSALISDSLDDDREDNRRLVVGRFQCQVPKTDCVVTLSMCHHPHEWLRDGSAVTNLLDHRASVQLTGHEHQFAVEASERVLRVRAGAVHPVRRGPWESRYSVVDLEIQANGKSRRLIVRLVPRKWVENEDSYVPHLNERGEEVWKYTVALPDCATATPRAEPQPSTADHTIEAAGVTNPEGSGPRPDNYRHLAYRFLTLSLLDRLATLRDVGLLESGDDLRGGRDLYEVAFTRARSNNQLANLWQEVERRHGSSTVENPFAQQEST